MVYVTLGYVVLALLLGFWAGYYWAQGQAKSLECLGNGQYFLLLMYKGWNGNYYFVLQRRRGSFIDCDPKTYYCGHFHYNDKLLYLLHEGEDFYTKNGKFSLKEQEVSLPL